MAAAARTTISPTTQAASGGSTANSSVIGRRAWAVVPPRSGVPDQRKAS
jgi:hypothetical protein